MIREILKIYTDNGLSSNPAFHDIQLTEYEYKPSRMGMPTLTATLMWEKCLNDEWTGREYVELRGERFYIRHTPSSEKNNTDERYRHSIEFRSEFDEILSNVYFEDYVSGSENLTYDKPCSNSSVFTFYGTIKEFSDRLNCAFLKAGVGDSILKTKTDLTTLDAPKGDGYCSMIDPYGDYDPDKSYEFSFEKQTLWEAITSGYNITEIPFERRARKIIWGAEPKVLSHSFKYGYDNELLSVSQNNANAKVVNRVTMLGSSENIPYFYPNETEYGNISVKATSGNKVLSDSMIEVVNRTQMLARLTPDTKATLGKSADEDLTEGSVEIDSYLIGFGESTLSSYTPGVTLQYTAAATNPNPYWKIRLNFNTEGVKRALLNNLKGQVWYINSSYGSPSFTSILSECEIESFTIIENGTTKDISGSARKKDGGIDLGPLKKGYYSLTLRVRFNAPEAYGFTAYCVLYGGNITTVETESTFKNPYFWQVGDKIYNGEGSLGIKIKGGATDAMVGDSFLWTAIGRMPFQERLVPPKYRNTLGAERFYNAYNEPYNEPYANSHKDAYIDPDTQNPYKFINPFIEGAPVEHIYENEDIKPTIEGIKNASGLFLGEIAGIAFDDNDNDSLKVESTEENDKNDSLKYEHSYFYIKLNKFDGTYGFNLFEHASQTDPMTIQMTSGACNGCKFKVQVVEFEDETGLKIIKNPVQTDASGNIASGSFDNGKTSDSVFVESQQDTSKNSVWLCVQKDAETFGVIMPNQEHKYFPKKGDTFNIINIDLPDAYIYAAEKRLEEEGMRYMSDNNEEKFTFDINASRIFFAEHPEVLAELDEYSKVRVEYDGKIHELFVSSLTINCKDNEPLPEIRIDLTDTIAVGQSFQQRIEERALSLIANATGGGGGASGGLNVVLADMRYLNKMKNDRTPYNLNVGNTFTSEGKANFGSFIKGFSGAQINSYGNAEVESIVVRSYMKVFELIYNRINALEGDTSFADSGQIETTVAEEDGTYTFLMRQRWEGDFTAFQKHDILFGYVNDISFSKDGYIKGDTSFYKAWCFVNSVDRANNTINVTLYADSQVPAQKNFPFSENMTVARWGNTLEPSQEAYDADPDVRAFLRSYDIETLDGLVTKWINTRQQSFFISSEQGNLVELMGVNKPILERENYGVVLGQIPEGLLDDETMKLINQGQPYLYARGIVVQDLIRIGYEGVKVRTPNFRGQWEEETALDDTLYYRITDDVVDVVTHDGALWQVNPAVLDGNPEDDEDTPKVSGRTNSDPPSDSNPDWIRLTSFNYRIWNVKPSVNTIYIREGSYSTSLLQCVVMMQDGDGEHEITTPEELDGYGMELTFSLDGVAYREFWVRKGETVEGIDLDDDDSLDMGGNNVPWIEIGDYIYLSLREKESGDVKDAKIVPVVKDGTNGENGESVKGDTGEPGKDGKGIEQRYKVVSSEATAPVISESEKSERAPSGWSVTMPPLEVFQDLYAIQASIDADDNLIGQWSDPFRITGHNGEPGKEGLMPYPAGVFNPAVTYDATGSSTPVVMYGTVNDVAQYYVLNRGKKFCAMEPEFHGLYTDPATDYANGGEYWTRFDSFNLIFANVIMAEFAKLGEAVFKDEFMFSQGGYLPDGTYTEKDYRLFGQGFEPNFQIDFRKGHVTMRSGEYYGFMRQKMVKITDENIMNYYDPSMFAVSWMKAGGSIWLETATTVTVPYYHQNWSQEQIDLARSYLNVTIAIYNNASSTSRVTGFLWEHTIVNKTNEEGHRVRVEELREQNQVTISSGCMRTFKCICDKDDSGYERLSWEASEEAKIFK